MTDYAELRALLETGQCARRLYYDPCSTVSVEIPTVEVIRALGKAVISLACRVEFLENQIKPK